MVSGDAGQPNQKTRTRKDLLDAASRLMKQGGRPTLEEVAEEALVFQGDRLSLFPQCGCACRRGAAGWRHARARRPFS